MGRLREQWAALPKNPDGSVKRDEHDYLTRVGICSEPVSRRELNVFIVTHKVTFRNMLQCNATQSLCRNDDDDDIVTEVRNQSNQSIYYIFYPVHPLAALWRHDSHPLAFEALELESGEGNGR